MEPNASENLLHRGREHMEGSSRSTEILTLAIMIITSAFTNGTLIRFILSEERCRTHTNLLVLSQCLTDLLTTFFIMPMVFLDVTGINRALPASLCVFHDFLSHWFLSLTMLNIAALILDRYHIIVKRRWNFGTRKRILALITVFWLQTFLLAFAKVVPFYGQTTAIGYYSVAGCFSLPLRIQSDISRQLIIFIELIADKIMPGIVISYCFYYLVQAVHSTRLKVVAMQDVHNWRKMIVGVYAKSANTCIIITVSFFSCIIPYSVTQFLQSQGIPSSKETIIVVTWLWFANTTIKPVVYISRSDQWLKGYFNYLKRRRRTRFCRDLKPSVSNDIQAVSPAPSTLSRRVFLSPQAYKADQKIPVSPKDFYDIFKACGEITLHETSLSVKKG